MFRFPSAVRGARIVALCCGGLSSLGSAAAQTAPVFPSSYHADWRDGAELAGAGVLYVLPYLLKLPSGPPPCAPCDPGSVWSVDRVGIRSHSAGAGTASSVLLVAEGGLAFGAALDGARGSALRGRLAVLADAGMWSVTASGWIKALVHRSRPVLYTAGAPAAAMDRDSRMSFPSGHATLGFAIASAYLEMARRDHAPHATRNAILLFG
ncbi:MAG TPA: phosphatase PAP2 family protein, partial [Gemmatimonadales bacterium]|nr:phosphatase PAP2 family protein [Gemmatimonadales bacterium]